MQPQILIRDAKPDDIDSIARVLASSFGALFRAEYGLRQAEVTTLLSELYRKRALPLGKVLTACMNEEVIGVAILSLPRAKGQKIHESPCRPSLQVYRSRLGLRRALRAAIGSSVMQYYFAGRTPAAAMGAGYVNALAVEERSRRQGAGRRLVMHCCSLAEQAGCQELALHVSDAKPEVRHLYESCGFEACRDRRFLPLFVEGASALIDRITRRYSRDHRATLMVRSL